MITEKEIEEHNALLTMLMAKAPDGPWKIEPHRMEFQHAGLDCLMVRVEHGAWCGYVGLPKTHPHFGKHYDDVRVEVHGGLTYNGECRGNVCHLADNENAERWWFGFDCLHGGDFAPLLRLPALPGLFPAEGYRDAAWVKAETEQLARQLAEQGA